MKDSLYIISKYWRKHKKSLIALLFSGVLLVIVISVTLFQLRAVYNRDLHDGYDKLGQYDVMLPDAREEFIGMLSDENTLRGEIYVLGEIENGEDNYAYGFLDDPEGIAHIPLENGRLPEREGEIAIDRGVLDRLGYFGKVGDSIALDIGEFTLVGIIDEKYGDRRWNSEISYLHDEYGTYGTELHEVFPIPLLYVGSADKEKAEFSLTMLHKLNAELIKNALAEFYTDEGPLVSRLLDEEYKEVMAAAHAEYGDGKVNSNFLQYADKDYRGDYYETLKANDIRLLFMWAGLAAVIAVLSIISVLRNIFEERKSSMAMLHRIGLSKRKIRLLYAVECGIFVILQTVIGIGVGILCHLGIYAYQVNVLDMTPYTGLTFDPYVTRYTASPYLAACLFSAIVLSVGYIFTGLISNIKPRFRHGRKAASLRGSFSKTFRTGTVTVIQTAALSLICFGTMIGYMFFTDSEKGYFDDTQLGIKHVLNKVENFGKDWMFNFEEDGLEEYYHAPAPQINGIGSFKFTADKGAVQGIGDDTANQFENAVSTGRLENTFVITKTKHDRLKRSIVFGTAEEKQFMIDSSADEYKSLFTDENHLYQMQTMLADERTVGSLSDFVIAGEINIDKLRSGEQVILMLASGDTPLDVGDSVTLASAVTENGYGLSGLVTADTTVGAIVKLNNPDKLLKYAVTTGDDYGFLTTASGAKAMGLHNAAYTEVFAAEPLDGKLFPMGSGMELLSYSVEKRRIFLQKAAQYGSTILIVLLMSLLGFAAYFNGIGMKVRLKEYQISTLRAIGTSTKKLRRKLMLYSLKIPLMACAVAYGGVKLIQSITYRASLKLPSMYLEAGAVSLNENLDDEAIFQLQSKLYDDIYDHIDKFFLEDELWLVKTVIPMLVIFAVMSIITVLLTRLAFRRFGTDISQSMSNGRKRR